MRLHKQRSLIFVYCSSAVLLILYQSEICAECVCTVRMSRMYVERRMNGEKKDIHSFHRYCDLVITMHDVQSDQRCVAMEVLVACPPLVYWFPYLNLV